MFLLFKRNLLYCKIPFALSKRVLAFTIGIVIVYLHVQNEEISAYIYLQHYHIAVRKIQGWITNKQSVCFLFVFLENITFQIFFGAFAKGSFACSQLLEFGRQNDLPGNTDVNVSWDVPKSAYSTLNNWWREQNVDKAWNGALNKT